ncbi:nucleotide exchange factor GrpE [Rhodococcus sp. X156]|uniref:nucleotide exchange factor GrpE n=1 Tax=Rhodococcus sp. X156 TaxID=2499145 RepID=UPI001F495FB9|nr:nucleotide exchange factor GrpE [Rhodococcus sp. X156]
MSPREEEHREEPVRVTDRRRIDPETGQVRPPGGPVDEADLDEVAVEYHDAEPVGAEDAVDSGVEEGAADEGMDPLQTELLERTADLQRVSAEYANYRRRVERDRQQVIGTAKASVVSSLLGVLDDLARARSHGDLQGPLKAVSDKLTDALVGQGLAAFGAEGDPFDPALHEAVSHEGSGGEPVLSAVMRQGYRFGDRVLRPAMVAVSEDPVPDAGSAPAEDAAATSAVQDKPAE